MNWESAEFNLLMTKLTSDEHLGKVLQVDNGFLIG
jgi:hypothetical protein